MAAVPAVTRASAPFRTLETRLGSVDRAMAVARARAALNVSARTGFPCEPQRTGRPSGRTAPTTYTRIPSLYCVSRAAPHTLSLPLMPLRQRATAVAPQPLATGRRPCEAGGPSPPPSCAGRPGPRPPCSGHDSDRARSADEAARAPPPLAAPRGVRRAADRSAGRGVAREIGGDFF